MAGAIDVFSWNVISSTPANFTLTGGAYGVTLHAGTWGTATLQRLSVDGTTWVAVLSAQSADGYNNLNLPFGSYRMLLAGVSGFVGDITSIVVGV